ncbi:DUF1692-domain-containing protein [Amanita rubescens]|nr:DUF1692-domain-containing protein [Amanita rubescens]
MAQQPKEESLLDKLDSVVPAPLAQFDAFPKLPSTYKARSESRGFMTIFVVLVAFLLVLNDIGEYIWGWPDYEFSVDREHPPLLLVNLDMTVNMPCKYLSIDLRDALGDRVYLTGTVRRDGTVFDASKATEFKEHAAMLSARQAVAQSKSSRGLFDAIWSRRNADGFKPTYNHKPDGDACRIWGTTVVKRVTANLHITTLGHGYSSFEHVDHKLMNLSHVISEFSFGPHFPDIVQPLDYTFEVTHDPFVAYQYFLHVVPTTYIAPRSRPLKTNQYSEGTPGIFFKFDLDPIAISVHQKTTSLIQLLIRCVGVLGGVFVCMGYAIRITTRAVAVVSGADQTPGIVAAESSGIKAGLRSKWGGTHLRSRSLKSAGKMIPQGSGWVMEGGSGSPYASYNSTPTSTPAFISSPYTPHTPYTPHLLSNSVPPPPSGPPTPGSAAIGLGLAGIPNRSNPGSPNPQFLPLPPTPAMGGSRSPQLRPTSPYSPGLDAGATSMPGTPGMGVHPLPRLPSPNLNLSEGNGGAFHLNGNGGPPPPRRGPKKDD